MNRTPKEMKCFVSNRFFETGIVSLTLFHFRNPIHRIIVPCLHKTSYSTLDLKLATCLKVKGNIYMASRCLLLIKFWPSDVSIQEFAVWYC